jgi:hypothetical protein
VCSVDCVVPVAAIIKSEDIFSLINANVFLYSVKGPIMRFVRFEARLFFSFIQVQEEHSQIKKSHKNLV